MRYAILSDMHSRREKLAAVLNHAQARGAGHVLSLGDVGGDGCLALLRQAGAWPVLGNYEVSGWRRLAPEHRPWVRGWRPLLTRDDFMAVHAAPWWPDGLQTAEEFGRWLEQTRQPWRALFPYLDENEGLLWQALAELETAGKAILFHGHTHRQAAWRWTPAGHLQPVRGMTFQREAGHRYLVGVGSVGLPEDGGWAAYTLYDADTGQVEWIRLDAPVVGSNDH